MPRSTCTWPIDGNESMRTRCALSASPALRPIRMRLTSLPIEVPCQAHVRTDSQEVRPRRRSLAASVPVRPPSSKVRTRKANWMRSRDAGRKACEPKGCCTPLSGSMVGAHWKIRSDRPAIDDMAEAHGACLVASLEALERTRDRAGELDSDTARGRPVDRARIFLQAAFGGGFIQHLANRPGHVHAAPQLIETFGNAAQARRIRLAVVIDPPDVE